MLYLAMGMVVFRLLESHDEQLGILKAKQAVAHMLIKYNISDHEMREFVKIITEAESWGYTNGWLEKWSFTGSLFFSGTVITTIGKFHVDQGVVLNLFLSLYCSLKIKKCINIRVTIILIKFQKIKSPIILCFFVKIKYFSFKTRNYNAR